MSSWIERMEIARTTRDLEASEWVPIGVVKEVNVAYFLYSFTEYNLWFVFFFCYILVFYYVQFYIIDTYIVYIITYYLLHLFGTYDTLYILYRYLCIQSDPLSMLTPFYGRKNDTIWYISFVHRKKSEFLYFYGQI